MRRYELPQGMRYSTLTERKRFYKEEFSLESVKRWLEDVMNKPVFAVIIGRHTKIYPKKYREDASTTIIIDEYNDPSDVKEQIMDFVPEAVYYDRNIYDNDGKIMGQEMAFDLDPENLICPVHGSLEDKMARRQGLSFCELELQMVRDETLRLYEQLRLGFSRLKVVYSGRGFHIHVLDKDTLGWSRDQREKLLLDLDAKCFRVDDWVTSGGMRLIRLPYSLHGMVSRIVTPLALEDLEDFDPIRDERCIPRFFRMAS